MSAEKPLAAMRPGPNASAQPALRVFQSGDRVMTRTGELPVERLRPGDLVITDPTRDGVAVQWMELRRCAASGKTRIQILFGRQKRERAPQTDLPLGGRISAKTGKLELDTAYASMPGSDQRVH